MQGRRRVGKGNTKKATVWLNLHGYFSNDEEKLATLECGVGCCLQGFTNTRNHKVHEGACVQLVRIMEEQQKKSRGKIIRKGNFLRIMQNKAFSKEAWAWNVKEKRNRF